jgi:hypothetical protein
MMPGKIVFLIVSAMVVGQPAFAQGVDLALLPAEVTIGTGAQFDLELTVPDTSSEFNAFELRIEYDNSVLALISNQEGPLVVGVCGNRFHVFDDTDGIFTVTDALLCAGVRVAGPGVIYRLTFQAIATNTITTVILRSARFSDGGISVSPVGTSNALALVGDVTGLPGDPRRRQDRLHVPYPNPFRNAVHLGFTAGGETAVRLEIYSVSGHRVRSLSAGSSPAGSARVLLWDGADEEGRKVAPGVYLVRLVAGDRVQSRRIVKTE